eukprot:6109664-Pyramimonas_sp.AAC.1
MTPMMATTMMATKRQTLKVRRRRRKRRTRRSFSVEVPYHKCTCHARWLTDTHTGCRLRASPAGSFKRRLAD